MSLIGKASIALIVVLLSLPALHNGYIASHCSDYHIPGKTWNRNITLICTPEWERLTQATKK